MMLREKQKAASPLLTQRRVAKTQDPAPVGSRPSSDISNEGKTGASPLCGVGGA